MQSGVASGLADAMHESGQHAHTNYKKGTRIFCNLYGDVDLADLADLAKVFGPGPPPLTAAHPGPA